MKSIFPLLLLFVSLTTHGQQAFSLQQAIDYAIQNGYSVKNAMTDVEIARKKVVETRGIGLPQLTTEASYQNFLNVPVSLIQADAFDPTAPPDLYLRLPFGIKHNLGYGYTASWLAFSGEYLVGLQASRTYLDYSKTSLRKSEIEIKEAVSRAYYTVLILDQNRQILDQNIENLTTAINEAQAFNKEGFVEELDVDRLKLTRTNLETTRATLQQQRILAEKLLKFNMGFDVNADISLTDKTEALIAAATAGVEAEPKFDMKNNIDFLLLENAYSLQALNKKRYKANYLPTLSTFYAWKESRLSNSFSDLDDPNFRVTGGTIFGVSISMPIFQGMSQRARVQQAGLELKKIEVQQQQQQQGYYLQSAQALSDYKTALKTYEDTKAAMELAEKIRSQSNIKYKEGVGSSIEVIQAQNEQLSAQANYINSVMKLLDSRIVLDKQLNKF